MMVKLRYKCNSAYGILKDRNSPCFDPLQSNNVCLSGQWYLTELSARIEDYCKVLQINTDGIYMLCKDMETVYKIQKIAKEWEERTKLDLEWDIFPNGKLVQKDVNNYLLIDNDTGKYKCKGAYVKKLSPIDYDMPILNTALVNYFVHNIPVEQTINAENNLIEFQKVIKLTSLYKGVVYGTGVKTKVQIGNKTVDRIMVEDGIQLKEKVHRVFASNRAEDKGIYKVKIEKGQKSFEKVANTPDKCFIDNDTLNVDWYFDEASKSFKYNTCKQVPTYLNRQYYIDLANERIRQFIEPEPAKMDDKPEILFDCYNNSSTFYGFLANITKTKITTKVLKEYLIADCCNKYGKIGKLLEFTDYFNILFGKDNFTVGNLQKKISDDKIREIIADNSTLSKTGKKYIEADFKTILMKIFDILEDIQIDESDILQMQIEKFDTVRYTNPDLKGNRFFVLNTRNVVKPNLILYNMKTGKTTYTKVSKSAFNILPLQDGDIIDVKTTAPEYGMKICGKDSDGVNILAVDITKQYEVITGYEIVHRIYNKNTKLLSVGEGD